MKVTDYIAEFLSINGVDVIFGYQGSSIAHMIDSIERHPSLHFIETRHEQAAAFAANGYALAKNKLGVAVACSGPGAINLLSGIADAFYDSIPCLFITGQVSQKEMKTNPMMRQAGFQETDIVAICEPITKYAVSIKSADDIEGELLKAIQIAYDGRPGPVLIDIPHNIQGSQINDHLPAKVKNLQKHRNCGDVVLQVAEKVNKAKRPVILIGGGCRSLDKAVLKKIDTLNLPVVTSYMGKRNFDNSLSVYCGTIGVYGERYANWAVKYSDLVIVLGSRLDGRQTGGEMLQKFNDAETIVVDLDEYELSHMPQEYTKINSDAVSFLSELVSQLELDTKHEKWLKTILKWKARYNIKNEYKISEKVNPNLFLSKLSNLADDNAVFAIDVGQNQLWSNSSLCIGKEQILLQSGGLGSMGFSLPAAVGGFYATGHQTICISGDGGIQMNIQELQTVKAMKLPLKVFILNNNCLGLIRDYQYKALGGRYYGSIDGFGSPDYEKIADAYGIHYYKIETNDMEEKLRAILQDSEACLVEVLISQWSTAFPEPTYQSTIINQSVVLSEQEKKKVEEEVNECM